MSTLKLNWFERHCEKVALGAAGSVLLAVVFFYVIRDPNTVIVDGQPLGPKAFYAALQKQADEARLAMRNAPMPKLDDIPEIGYARASLPGQSIGPICYPNPPVPALDDIGDLRDIKLAAILAPTKPVVSTGKASARLPSPREVSVWEANPRANETG